jgi:hypothetical protein
MGRKNPLTHFAGEASRQDRAIRFNSGDYPLLSLARANVRGSALAVWKNLRGRYIFIRYAISKKKVL